MKKKGIPAEAIASLRARLQQCSPRGAEKRELVAKTAELYGVSRATVYRALELQPKPKSLRRTDHGKPRKLSLSELVEYLELVAALKVRTQNKKGRHISTVRAIEIIEEHGVETPKGLIKPPPGLLTRSLVNRYLKDFGYDHSAIWCEPPAVRIQAEKSNDCWQLDLSPSDLKHVDEPSWIDPERGKPTLMLFSVVDDRSGVNYQEYRCVYGEEAEATLRFLFNAMSPKGTDAFPLQGIPRMIYSDNAGLGRSLVFKRVMECLDITFKTHLPEGKDGRRKTARSKGKVERAFRTVKELHETLYHFHKPKSDNEANEWLMNYLIRYNEKDHRSEEHSRNEDWLMNLPEAGFRAMCSWERFCSFAREPERKKVGKDCRINVDGVNYEVEPDLADEWVLLWWGLFDNEVYVEHGEQKFGPYRPVDGPIPLNHYRRFKKTKKERRADKVHELAAKINLPRSVVTGKPEDVVFTTPAPSSIPFSPEEKEAPDFPDAVHAKLAIAQYLGRPLASLPNEDRAFIAELVAKTLDKKEVLAQVKSHFTKRRRKGEHRAR